MTQKFCLSWVPIALCVTFSSGCFLFESYELEIPPKTDATNETRSAQPIACSQDNWCIYESPIKEVAFTGIWGSSSNDVWAVGQKGTIVH